MKIVALTEARRASKALIKSTSTLFIASVTFIYKPKADVCVNVNFQVPLAKFNFTWFF